MVGLGIPFKSEDSIKWCEFFYWRRHFYLNAFLDQGQIYSVLCKIEFAMNQRETYDYVNTNKLNSTGEFF